MAPWLSATSDAAIALKELFKAHLFNLMPVFLRVLQSPRPFTFDLGVLLGRCIDDRPDRMGVLPELDLIELCELLGPDVAFLAPFQLR